MYLLSDNAPSPPPRSRSERSWRSRVRPKITSKLDDRGQTPPDVPNCKKMTSNWPQTLSLFFGGTVQITTQPICVVEIAIKFYLWDNSSPCHLSIFLLSIFPFPQYFLSEQPWSKVKPKAISLLNFLEDGLKYTEVFQVSVVHNIRHFDLLSRTQLCNVVELIRVVQYAWKRDISGVLSFDNNGPTIHENRIQDFGYIPVHFISNQNFSHPWITSFSVSSSKIAKKFIFDWALSC